MRKDVVAQGKPLIPSAACEAQYRAAIRSLMKTIYADYKKELTVALNMSSVSNHFANDDAPKRWQSIFKSLFTGQRQAWQMILNKKSNDIYKRYAIELNKHAFATVGESLRTLGIQAPKDVPQAKFDNLMQLHTHENVSLITNLGNDVIQRIENSVWNSLTAIEGTEQGSQGIYEKVKAELIKDATTPKEKILKRADLIATDQTSKLYSVLTNARLEQNGVTAFEWLHSSAAKIPRKCHQAWDRQIFLTKGGPSELYRQDGTKVMPGDDGATKYDIGKPGYPIKCGCRASPVFDFD